MTVSSVLISAVFASVMESQQLQPRILCLLYPRQRRKAMIEEEQHCAVKERIHAMVKYTRNNIRLCKTNRK
ncbi:hypothetical protein C5167_042810 [Papaver somniferum]|uniref:Uncharacterized protein n=1 Tax=Papaver somniferum TaxID=3469 RepID=A0A4Y7L4X6_PAPSO|nr:hypothetical protein C5167_042810 [Papaver somniferum]